MTEKKATFRNLKEGKPEDWEIIREKSSEFSRQLHNRILAHLQLLGGDYGGFPVDRLTHCLQTATLAHRDGRDEEYVVCALLHDIGDTLGPENHPEIAATILKPYISEKNHWMITHHGLFQGYYFFHHFGIDRNVRDNFAGHPWYDYTVEFCEKYDQAAFDPDYDTLPLDFFAPMVERVFSKPKQFVYFDMVDEPARTALLSAVEAVQKASSA